MVDFAEGDGQWRIPVVPLAVNVILHPLPTPRRCYKLGQALRRAILSYPEDLGVVVVGTGGLSRAAFEQTLPDDRYELIVMSDGAEPEREAEVRQRAEEAKLKALWQPVWDGLAEEERDHARHHDGQQHHRHQNAHGQKCQLVLGGRRFLDLADQEEIAAAPLLVGERRMGLD